MADGNNVREQFSALQKQQKERLSQLQEKTTKKKVPTADVRLQIKNVSISFSFIFFSFRQVFQ